MAATNYAGKYMDYLGQRIYVGSFVGPNNTGDPCIVCNEEHPIGFSMFLYMYTHTLPGFKEEYDYEDYLYYHAEEGAEPVINPATGEPYEEGDIMIDPNTLQPYRVTVTSTRDITEKYWYPVGPDGNIRWAFGMHMEDGVYNIYFKFSTGEWTETIGLPEPIVHPEHIIQYGEKPSAYDLTTLAREGWNRLYHQYWQGGSTGAWPGFAPDIEPESLDFLNVTTLSTITFYCYNTDGVSSGSASDSVAFRSWFDASKPYHNIYVPDKYNNWGPDPDGQFVVGVFSYDTKEYSNWTVVWGLRQPFSGHPLPLMTWDGPTEFMGDEDNTVTCYQGWGNTTVNPSNAYCLGGDTTGMSPANTICPLDCGTIVEPDTPYPDPYDDSNVYSDDDDDTPVPPGDDDEDSYHPEGFDGKTSDEDLPSLDITSTGLYQLYLPTTAQLQAFSNWLWTEDYKDAIAEWSMEPMSQIVMFGMVPFKASAGSAGVVHMAGVSSGISMTKAASMWVKVWTNEVKIPGPVNSWLDYTSTRYMLYLPLIGFVPLKTEDVIWGKMKIQYRANIVTGEFVAQVWVAKSLNSNKVGFSGFGSYQILYSYNGNCLFNLPLNGANYGAYYAGKKNDIMGIIGDIGSTIGGAVGGFMMGGPAGAVAGGLLAGANSVNGIFDKATHLANSAPEVQRSGSLGGSTCLLSHSSPYIICNQPKKYTKGYSNHYGWNTYRGDLNIGSYKGWIYCSKVRVNCSGTETEQEMISKLLRDGVYIK